MKIILKSITLFFMLTSFVQASPLTERTYQEFHEVSKTKITIEKMIYNNQAELDKLASVLFGGKPLSDGEKAAFDKLKQRSRILMESQVGYEVLMAQIKPLYMDNFTEEEMRGVIDFYITPTGQAIVDKMPILAEHMGTMIFRKMEAIKPEAVKLVQDFTKELQAARAKDSP